VAAAGLLIAVLLLAVALPRARGGEEAQPTSEAAASGYVGSEACARCHRKEFELWEHSSHAHTFLPASEDTLPTDMLEGGTLKHAPGSTTVHREGQRFVVETLGPNGKDQRYDLTHVVGRMRIRMFVATLPDGRRQVLPAMLEEPTQAWFDYTHLLFGAGGTDYDAAPKVAPGDGSFWTGTVRSFDARCARCHTSGWRSVRPDAKGRGPRSTWRAVGVDCESCHGPGRAHTEAWARLDDSSPMARIERLPRSQALATCLRCHMEAEVVSPIFRPDVDIYEQFDPTLMLDPERADMSGRALELIYDGLPFGTSRCAQEGGLTCFDCHDPHGSGNPAQLRHDPASGALCASCHEDIVSDIPGHTHHNADGEGASCIACHMPPLKVERGHGIVTDHTIGIPRLDLQSDRVARDACTSCHGPEEASGGAAPMLAVEKMRAAYGAWWPSAVTPPGWMTAIGAARLGAPEAGAALRAVAGDKEQYRLVRASAAALLGRYSDTEFEAILLLARDEDSLVRRNALRALGSVDDPKADAALRNALSDTSAAVRLVAARTALQGWRRVQENRALLEAILPVLEDDARRVPDDDQRWYRLGAAREIAGDVRGAVAAYDRMLALDSLAHIMRKHVEGLRKQLK